MRDSAVMTGQAVVGRLIGVVSNMLLVRLLDVGSFGILTVVSTASANAYGLARLGIDAAVHVETAAADATQNQLVRGEVLGTGLAALMATGALAAIGTFVAAPWLARRLYGSPDLDHWLRIAALIVFAQCIAQFGYAAVAGLHRFAAYAKAVTVSTLAGAVLMASGAYVAGLNGAVAAAVIAAYALAAAVGYVLVAALRQSGTLSTLRVRPARAWAMVKLGAPLYLSGLVTIPVTAFLQGLLTKTEGTDGLAYLRIVTVFSSLVGFIPHSIAAVTVSNLSSARASGYGTTAFQDAAVQRIKLVWSFALLAGLAIELALPVAIPLLFGQQYAAAVAPAMLAVGSSILLAVSGVLGQVSYAGRYPRLVLGQALVAVTVMAAVGLSLIQSEGLIGYMTADLAANATAAVFLLWRAKATWLEHAQGIPLERLAAVSFIAIGLSWYSAHQSLAALPQAFVGLALLGIAGLIVFQHILSVDERTTLLNQVRLTRRR